MNRRVFFANLASLVGLMAVSSWGSSVLAERKRGGGNPPAGGAGAGGDVTMVDPKSQMAVAVHYTENKSAIKDSALKQERSGVPFEKQKCKDCQFFSDPKQHNGGEVGKCSVLGNNYVKADAWCTTWSKKA
jgi:hypothetical protein